MSERSKTYQIGIYTVQVGRDVFATPQGGCYICGSKRPISVGICRYINQNKDKKYNTIGKQLSLCTPCSEKHGFFSDRKSMKKGIAFLKMKDLI